MNDMNKKLFAEMLGTAWLVLGGCGTAVLAGSGVHAGRLGDGSALAVLAGADRWCHCGRLCLQVAVLLGRGVFGLQGFLQQVT